MLIRALKNLLFVIWVPVIALVQILPKGNESWQNYHTAYIFYYAVGPMIACWLAFLYLGYSKNRSPKVVAVVVSTIVAAALLLLSFFGVNYILPDGYGIGMDMLGVLILDAIMLAVFIIGAIFAVLKKDR